MRSGKLEVRIVWGNLDTVTEETATHRHISPRQDLEQIGSSIPVSSVINYPHAPRE